MSVAATSDHAPSPAPSRYLVVKRGVDAAAAAVTLVLLSPLLLIVAALVRATSPGPALHWSVRGGKDGLPFDMPKFRSMRKDAPNVATRHLDNPDAWLTPIGKFLRRTSLDELPQLWSVFIGDMSFIGPRPVILEEADLLEARALAGVTVLRPGISGWAQVNGRDSVTIEEKVALDSEYLRHCSVSFDLMIMLKTAKRVFLAVNVWH